MSNVITPGADTYDVHLGVWTNWAKGKVYGATITTTRPDGGVLTAFLALFVAAAGKSIWRISCLLLHRYLSSTELEDALHHQRQAVLRNAETPESAFWLFVNMASAWRKKAQRSFSRLVLFLVFSIAIFTAYNAAGLFSSRVTTDTASEVLLTGNDCRAPWKPDDMDDSVFRSMYDIWGNKQNTASLNYAQRCYMNNDNDQDCRQYAKSKIDFQVTRNADCPFDDKMCKTKTMILDTGLLNSNIDLGLNMPSDSQFQFRAVAQCAPIISKGYSSIHNQTHLPDVPLLRFHYGNYSRPGGNGTAAADYVYQVAANLSYAFFEGTDFQLRQAAHYDVGVMTHLSGDLSTTLGFQAFSLIPELNRSDADVSLFFLSASSIFYTAEIDDPWFSAHRIGKQGRSSLGKEVVNFYMQDEAASVLGCTQQYQICNPNAAEGKQCNEPAGFYDMLNHYNEVWGKESEDKKKVMEWIYFVLQQGFISPDTVVDMAGESALSAAFGLGYSMNGPLPDNQWENEILWWSSASMASLQKLFVDYANGPATLPSNVSAPPTTEQGKRVCKSQRIMSTRFSSFSVLGVALILALGGLFILTDLTLESALDRLQHRFKRPFSEYARLEWKANATLQIQRLAYEGAHSGSWSRTAHTVPVTLPGQRLVNLDISEKEHPKLVGVARSEVRRVDTEATLASKAVSRQDSEQTLRKESSRQHIVEVPPTPPSRLREEV